MSTLLRSLAPALLGLANLAAQSQEFAPLLSTADRTWPEKHHIGVVCRYASSKEAIADLASAARSGTHITVVDARTASQVNAAQAILKDRNIDYLVLLPRDPDYFEGGFPATVLVGRMAVSGIPSVGTRPVGLRQGTVFSIGPDTNGELLVTHKLVGTVSVILPNRNAKLELPSPASAGGSFTRNGVTVSLLQPGE